MRVRRRVPPEASVLFVGKTINGWRERVKTISTAARAENFCEKSRDRDGENRRPILAQCLGRPVLRRTPTIARDDRTDGYGGDVTVRLYL